MFEILAFMNGDILIFQTLYETSFGQFIKFPDDKSAFN